MRLAVLDVDGTLKEAVSPYQFLHGRLGVAHLASKTRELALAGKIPPGEWLRRDVALWEGQPVDEIRRLLSENPLLPGAADLLRALKQAGVVIALVSAGFTLNTDPLAAEFEIEHVLANELLYENGTLSGKAVNRVPKGGKAAFARRLMARVGAQPGETLAAGDTHVDLELFDCAGVRIAVNPLSEALAATADVVFEPDLIGAVAWLTSRGFLDRPESP